MAMMMAGRVLLVCALCVLWCGAGGRCDEGEDTAIVVVSPGGRSNDGKGGPGPAPPSPTGIGTSGPLPIVPESEVSQERIPGAYSEGRGEKKNQNEDGVQKNVAEDVENSRNHERLSEQSTQKEESQEETPEEEKEKDAYPPAEEVVKGTQQSLSQKPPPQQLQVQTTAPAGRGGPTATTGPARPPAPAEPSSMDGSRTIEPTDSRNPSQESHDKSLLQTKTESSAPEPPLKDAFPEQHGQGRTTPDSMLNASAGSQARNTAPSTSTSGSGEAESEADAQRPNPNKSHDDSDSRKTKVSTTLSEATPQTTETVATAQTNHTNTTGDSDGSTAVSHTTSPLLLLLVVACAAAAAVVAA
ncbi:Mucin-associated surface protein (MASP), subgroup S080 [Trypanosoma cruzi]|nr:Mucin-associated surface protein (MASP), subgroup S080 [Trypanosoma cruzi]